MAMTLVPSKQAAGRWQKLPQRQPLWNEAVALQPCVRACIMCLLFHLALVLVCVYLQPYAHNVSHLLIFVPGEVSFPQILLWSLKWKLFPPFFCPPV